MAKKSHFLFQARNLIIAPEDLVLGFAIICAAPPLCSMVPWGPWPGRTEDALGGTASFSVGCSVDLHRVFQSRNGSKVGAVLSSSFLLSSSHNLSLLAHAWHQQRSWEKDGQRHRQEAENVPLEERDRIFCIRKMFNVMALYSWYFYYALLWSLYTPHKYEI